MKLSEPKLLILYYFIKYFGLHEQFLYLSLVPKSNMTSEKLI